VTAARSRTGRIAEGIVAAGLTRSGWQIVARNARSRHGELDIVALDGRTLVFVEVKASRWGTRHGPERPVHSIDFRKQRRIRQLATAWMAARRDLPPYTAIRFDAVGVVLDARDDVVELDHIVNAV
jgi:putative endonuclease